MVDRLRRTKARVKTSVMDESWTSAAPGREPVVPMEQDERFAAVMQRIEKLPELQRTVVKRAYLNGQTLKQIGAEMGIPLGTIKSALSRALVRLRERNSGEELVT
jgi:RNA polymerase sigma-70 factor (ECF subfamily)